MLWTTCAGESPVSVSASRVSDCCCDGWVGGSGGRARIILVYVVSGESRRRGEKTTEKLESTTRTSPPPRLFFEIFFNWGFPPAINRRPDRVKKKRGKKQIINKYTDQKHVCRHRRTAVNGVPGGFPYLKNILLNNARASHTM